MYFLFSNHPGLPPQPPFPTMMDFIEFHYLNMFTNLNAKTNVFFDFLTTQDCPTPPFPHMQAITIYYKIY